MSELNSVINEEYGSNFRVLKSNDQTCELQTIIRDKYLILIYYPLLANCIFSLLLVLEIQIGMISNFMLIAWYVLQSNNKVNICMT